MFDIGFWEVTLIAVVGLLVVGPERLPLVLGTVGRWLGRGRAYVSNVRRDIEREVRRVEAEARSQVDLAELGQAAKQAGAEVVAAKDALENNLQPDSQSGGSETPAVAKQLSGESQPIEQPARMKVATEGVEQ